MSGSRRNPSSTPVPSSAAMPEKWRSQAGFSLAELIVSLFVVVLLLVMILLLFDSTSKLARAQTYVAELQQSVRVAQDEMVRATRMASRGGLSRGNLPNGMVSVAVRNNVVLGSQQQDIGIGVAGSPKVMPNTDVLTVRGIYGTLYHVNSDPDAGTFTVDDPDNPTRGTVVVQNPVPSTGIPQSLQPLIAAVNANPPRPEALLLVSPLGGVLYHLVELDPQNSDVTNPSRITLAFTITGGARNADYSAISASVNFPTELRAVAQLGIVEEYRYYVRQILSDPMNPASEATTRLSRARFYPGSQVPHGNGGLPSMAEDIADDVIDLQVALAIDANGDNLIGPDTADANDEWLYNAAADDPNNAAWNGANKNLFYVRINTLARASRRDFQYVAEPIVRIEDRAYAEPADPAPADVAARQMRRRLLQTVVELRNL